MVGRLRNHGEGHNVPTHGFWTLVDRCHLPKFINTSPYHHLFMYTWWIKRKVQQNFPKISNGLKNEGIFKEIRLILRNVKNYEIEKVPIIWPFLVEMAPVFALELSLPNMWNFCFLNLWQPFCILAKIIFFNFGDLWSCPGVLFMHENGSESKFIKFQEKSREIRVLTLL